MSALHVLQIFGAFAFVIGAVLGSFANVCIARWPSGRSVIRPRSACPTCDQPVAAYDNVPILSWLLLRARCRHCQNPISARYPLVELLTGLLGWLLFVRIVHSPAQLNLAHGVAWAGQIGFILALLIATFVDLRHWIIPDEVSIYALPLGPLWATGLLWLDYSGPLAISPKASILGAAFAGGGFAAASLSAHAILGRDGLGWGDVKLFALIGAFLGVQTWLALLVASLIGASVHLVYLAITRRSLPLPFGPSLAAGALTVIFYGHTLTRLFFPGMLLVQNSFSS